MSKPTTPEALLESREICVLATISPDGGVHAMPMWYLFEEGKIWFMTGDRVQKTKNVQRTGKATVTLDLRERPYYAIMVKGDAEVGGPLPRERQLRLMTRYISEADANAYIDQLEQRGGNASIVVAPTKTVEFNSSV